MQKNLHNSMFVRGVVERRHAVRVARHVSAVRQLQYFASVDMDHEHILADFFDLHVAVDHAAHQHGRRVRHLSGQDISDATASVPDTFCDHLQASVAHHYVLGAALSHWIPHDVAVLEIPVDRLSVVDFGRIGVRVGRMDCQQHLSQ